MAKTLMFAGISFDPTTTAYETNAKEFISRSLVGDEDSKRSTKHFRQLLTMGEKAKVAYSVIQDTLQEADCDFVATDGDVFQKTIEPVVLNIGVEICQWDIEQSFLSDYTGPVENIDFLNTTAIQPEFEAYLLQEIAKVTSNNLENLTWKGNTAGSTNTYLDLYDGLEKKLFADPTVVKVQGTTLTLANIVDEIAKVYLAIPENLDSNVKIGLGIKAMRMFRYAVASNNNTNFITSPLADMLIDFGLVEFQGLSANKMVAAEFDKNFVYSTDISRPATFNVINLKATVGDRKYRIISDLKFGVDFIHGADIVYYTNQVIPS